MMRQLSSTVKQKLHELRQKFQEIPVPVIAIANDLGIKIYETFDFDNNESGSIKKENGEYVIYLNGLDSPARKRFTIAHEIGHFIMHVDYLNKGHEAITNIKQPLVLHRSPHASSQTEKEREIEANSFAAELLMPEEEFKKAFEQANSIDDISEKFNVSSSAAAVRAKDLLGYIII